MISKPVQNVMDRILSPRSFKYRIAAKGTIPSYFFLAITA